MTAITIPGISMRLRAHHLALVCLTLVLAAISASANTDTAEKPLPLPKEVQEQIDRLPERIEREIIIHTDQKESNDDDDDWEPIQLEALIAIPMVFLTPIAIVAIIAFANRRKRELVHQTIDKLIETGQPVPLPLLAALDRGNQRSTLRSGATNVALGLGAGIALWMNFDRDIATIALIPLFIGVAQIMTLRLERTEPDRVSP
ncbi:MAG: DUF6249 domain-containing protein [Pseudomonadales bacterium]